MTSEPPVNPEDNNPQQANIPPRDDRFNVGGDFVGGDFVGGDKVMGNKVGDDFNSTQYSQVSGSGISTGGDRLVNKDLPMIPMQLPQRQANFINRTSELAVLEKELKPGRVVNIFGPAGMGKTALATEILWRLSENGRPPNRFPDGIAWYSFISADQSEMINCFNHFAQSFGFPTEATSFSEAEDAARQTLNRKQALLVLENPSTNIDNFYKVLKIKGDCAVLITSHKSFREADFHLELSHLSIEASLQLLTDLAGESAADENLARLLGGKPLDIWIAAEYMRVNHISATDFLQQLQEQESKEDDGPIDLNQLSQGLDQHVTQLSDSSRNALAAITILDPNGFDVQEVTAVLNIPEAEVQTALNDLHTRDLIREDSGHYLVDPLVSQYIHDHLQPPADAQQRLADYRANQTERGLLVDFNADAALGKEDFLDIDRDINAFASLIAAKSVSPPLSIGVFGDWGSGKTFFMRRLKARVDTLAAAARGDDEESDDEKLQKEIGYYKRIVQVEFNAWHYVEGNLWASLVEHILRNLRINPEETVTALQKRRKGILNKLEISGEAKIQAAAREAELKVELEEKKEKLNELNAERHQRLAELEHLSAQGVLGAVELDEQTKTDLSKTLNDLGVSGLSNNTVELAAALTDLRATLQRGNALLTPMRERGWGWTLAVILVILTGPAVSLIVTFLSNLIEAVDVSGITNAMISLGAFLSTLTLLLKAGTRWLSRNIKRVEEAQTRLYKARDAAEAEYAKKIAAKQQEVTEAQREYEKASQAEAAAAQEIAELEQELQGLTPGRALMDFIQERIGSDDYRKHLGVVALIRRDFEILSSSIVEENDWLESDKISTIDDERKEIDSRINRIVLYIDDLDRCPPKRVVEVLQAIHLILAFPLFIVVVGVDSRWVSRSLKEHYKNLLGSDLAGQGSENSPLVGRNAGPHDYLEKIFQIPFWLEPLDEEKSKKMLAGLLKQPVTLETKEKKTQEDTGDDANSGQEGGGDVTPVGSATADPTTTSPPDPTASNPPADPPPPDTDPSSTPQPTTIQQPVKLRIDLNPKALEIKQEEALFMGELASLLNRSPRSIKRFVNTYRLIKAGLGEEELKKFYSTKTPETDFQIVMFLLAVITGSPKISQPFFEALVRSTPENLQEDLSFLLKNDNNFVGLDQEGIQARKQLQKWVDKTKWTDRKIERLKDWAHIVAQFSFRVERLAEAEARQSETQSA